MGIGLFALGVGIVLALQRHEFTHPNLQLPVICLVVLPWVVDIICSWPFRISTDGYRFKVPLLVVWNVVVLGGVAWLVVAYHGPNDIAPFVLTLLVGEMAATGGFRLGALVGLACVTILLVYASIYGFEGDYIWGFAFVIAFMGGTAYRQQMVAAHARDQAQEQLAERAAEEERRRLAREIHDLIAHSLAVTMLQLSGARLALTAGDTEEALAALHDAEAAGRSAMAEIRRTVGLLESADDERDPAVATPSAADIPALVTSFRQAGLSIELELRGDLGAVPLATGLAAYRVVQESLSNAVKHAPGAPVHLQLGVSIGELRINAVNPVVSGPSSNGSTVSGHGLRGMAERAELLGGTATAGNGDGTWKVAASIPWEVQTP
jgi:signal transduction histidine kinase